MQPIPLFGTSQQGKSSTVTSQRHLNLYAEIVQDAEKSRVVYYGRPGKLLFTMPVSFGDTPIRGGIPIDDSIYCVHRGTFWEINNAGVTTNRGTLGTTSGRVQMAYNGTQIAIVDGTSYYVYTIASTNFATVTTNLIATPIDVTYQDSYGILTFADGRFQITSAYAFQTLDALDFATAESNPDGLVRGIADHGEIVLCGSKVVEFWGNSGGQDFPYSNQRGSSLEFGLAAPWSLVKYNDSLAGLFRNEMGQVQVMMLVGHALRKISSNELDSIINAYGAVSDATALAFMVGGHPMYQINFASAGKSWLYDAHSDMWSPLESGLSGGRDRAEILFDFLNKPRVTDYSNGNIYTLDVGTYTDNGTAIPREIISRHIGDGFSQLAIHELQVNFEMGVGLISGQGSDPQVMMSFSNDHGKTWSNEEWVAMGAIGEYLTRAQWDRLGSEYVWTFKFRITDPVEVVITSGAITATKRR